ncbi:uncharacterized protein K452DRAFT_276472 [Aplosporella prunicola CBS 121167]|uniref:Tyrosinase copper-binding domain-containing protein n=1 Tax=Aplosporella prunicola CBS 121167 TaxID=1176127 RepID=A0A6A6B666_9PEZI|nr:uncharacterized protein K452DRAFT_276472 [Aplosporella prunicola CBS 121167]KAF2138744.1 hypothetical protein K452DRAFT_276472 [Aplosporella prunicola CBS 121167]
MYLFNIFEIILLFASIIGAVPTGVAQGTTWPLSSLAAAKLNNTNAKYEDLVSHALSTAKDKVPFSEQCTPENLIVRKEWGDLTREEQIDYTNAVVCFQHKTANTPSHLVPGAKSRYDDFVASHINQTFFIHFSATFLSWHRFMMWEYEEALRNECGYKGYQPYWDWTKTAASGSLETSAIFDGSETSLSGNGAPIANQGYVNISSSDVPVILPHGTGGGCVTSGPFVNYTVNLGPLSLSITNGSSIGSLKDQFAWNPRCLKRDLTNEVNQRFANKTSVEDLLLKTHDVYDFQMTMQGYPNSGELGVHGGGHYSMGGDPGRDFLVSPGDPAFYLHHSNIDRTWWMWQMMDPAERLSGPKALMGTRTLLNSPPSPNATYEDVLTMGYAGTHGDLQIKDVMSTTAGPFCYVYV